MVRRTTIEIDEALLGRAKRALGLATTRATVEEALRRAAEQAEAEHEARAARQREYLASLGARADLESELHELWVEEDGFWYGYDSAAWHRQDGYVRLTSAAEDQTGEKAITKWQLWLAGRSKASYRAAA